MQYSLFIFTLTLLTSLQSHAQCNRIVLWHASKAEMIDSTGRVTDSKEDAITILTSKDSILLTRSGDVRDIIKGAFTEKTCEWKEAFKNGKSNYRAQFISPNHENPMATVIIEGVNGKLILYLAFDKFPDRKMKIEIEK